MTTSSHPPGHPAAAGPFRQVTCIVAGCAGCGTQSIEDDEGYIPHFEDAGTARKALIGTHRWQSVPGPDGAEQLLCPGCACARSGHDPVTSPATTLEDGTLLGAMTCCERCGILLSTCLDDPPPARGQAHATAAGPQTWETVR